MVQMRCHRRGLGPLLLLGLALPAHAGAALYRGTLTVLEHSGSACQSGPTFYQAPTDLFLRDDGDANKYVGYIGQHGAALRRFAGRSLAELAVNMAVADRALRTREHLGLKRANAGALVGEIRADSVPPETEGCFIDRATLAFTLANDPKAESFDHIAARFRLSELGNETRPLVAKADFASALPMSREALATARELFGTNDPQIEPALTELIVALISTGNIPEAEPLVQELLMIDQQSTGPDNLEHAQQIEIVGQMEMILGHATSSERLLRRAVDIEERLNSPQQLANGLMALGQLYTSRSRDSEAILVLRRALALDEKTFGPDAAALAGPLDQLGIDLTNTGQYGEAEQVLRRALALAERQSPPGNPVMYVTSLASLLETVGRYAEAEPLARRALLLAEQPPGVGPIDIATAEATLASVLLDTHRDADAKPHAERALAIIQNAAGPNAVAVAGMLNGVGLLFLRAHDYSEAERLLKRAVDIVAGSLGAESPELVFPLMNLGEIEAATGRYEDTKTSFTHAYRLAIDSDQPSYLWHAAAELMYFYRGPRSPQPALAIFYGKMAVNTLQALRGNLGDAARNAQASFVTTVAPNYRTLADLLIEQGRLGEAQQVLAMLKEQEFFDFTRRNGSSDTRKTNVDLENSELGVQARQREVGDLSRQARALQDRLIVEGRLGPEDQTRLVQVRGQLQQAENAWQTQLTTLGGPPDNQVAAAADKYVSLGQEYGALQERFHLERDRFSPANKTRLNELRTAMDAAQAEFDSRAAAVAGSARDARAQQLRSTEINDFSRAFQGTLKDLGHDAVIAQYIILDDKVAILFTTSNVVVAREAPIKREVLNEQITAFRKTLSQPTQNPLPQAQALYRLLVGPIADDLRQAGAKTLMLDLDDILRYVPFAALHDGQHYLVESLSVVMVTEAVRDKLGKPPNPDWSVWGLGITKGGDDYEPLPYAAIELQGIAGRKGILSGKVMLDGAFDLNALRDGLDQSYPIIHIASHFQFKPGSMDDSFLLLGDGTHLTLADIKTKLNFKDVELLTLSACETAVGDTRGLHHGVEVEGLGAIAQQGGAKAVLATLWPVADESTAALMRTLYERHKQARLDKADALRQAQLALLAGTAIPDAPAGLTRRGLTRITAAAPTPNFQANPKAPYAHPYYWAPFILMGNWL